MTACATLSGGGGGGTAGGKGGGGGGGGGKGGKGGGGGKDSAALTEARMVIASVLHKSGYAENRASKMDQDDFLMLLARFNEAGVHFNNGSFES